MVQERQVQKPTEAREVWKKILERDKPSYITGLVYIPPEHGSYPQRKFTIMPVNRLKEVVGSLDDGEVFAIGGVTFGQELKLIPLVDNDVDSKVASSYLERTLSPFFTYQQSLPGFKRIKEIKERSEMIKYEESFLCLVDFECELEPKNTRFTPVGCTELTPLGF